MGYAEFVASLQSPKTAAATIIVAAMGLCVLWLRGWKHKKLNRTLPGACNDGGDHTRWLKLGNRLLVKPVVGYYAHELERDRPKISGYFLRNQNYNFVLTAPLVFRILGFRFQLLKSLHPVRRPFWTRNWPNDAFLRPGRTTSGTTVKLTNEALICLIGTFDSGKSLLSYELLHQLGSKTAKSQIYVCDLTKTFPKRVVAKVGATRITSLPELLKLAREVYALNEVRQLLLDRYDVDHCKHLPNGERPDPVWIFLEEAHVVFSRDQDLKSESGKMVKEIAELFNEVVLTGRKCMISIIYISQSALKSETLFNIGRARTFICGYLSVSESEAIGLREAHNTALSQGIFVVRSRDTGREPVIMQAWYSDNRHLNKPLELKAEAPSSAAAGGGRHE